MPPRADEANCFLAPLSFPRRYRVNFRFCTHIISSAKGQLSLPCCSLHAKGARACAISPYIGHG